MNNKKKIIMGLLIASLFLVAIGVTYAYFTSDINGLESSTSLTARGGVMKINYDGGAYITLSGIYPSDTAWATKNFTVTGKNTTDLDMGYKISMVVEENTFENDEITYSLSSTTPTIGTTANSVTKEYINGTGTKEIGTGNFTKTGTTSVVHSYKLTIDYPNKSEEQNMNQGAILKCYIKTEEYQTIDMPEKGDLISLTLAADEINNPLPVEYRVLKVNGTEAFVLAMSNYTTSAFSSSGTTTSFNGTTGLQYANSVIDLLLNSNDSSDGIISFYEKLNSTAVGAIKVKNISQNMYLYSDEPNSLETESYTYDYQYQYNWNDNSWDNIDYVASVNIGNRYVYLLDIKDIFDYVSKRSITSNELMNLFFKQTTLSTDSLWLSSAISGYSNRAWSIYGSYGEFGADRLGSTIGVRPAFVIDLSKIEYSLVNN